MDIYCWSVGLFRRFRSFVLKRDVEIIGQCKLCGNCCRDILIQDRGRFMRHKRQHDRLCKGEPEHGRFRITGRDDNGHLTFTCTLQGDDNFCTCYEDRLPLCRNYPSKSLYYQGGFLRGDCGFSFKAVTFRDIYMRRRRAKIPKFSEVLRKEQENRRQSS